MNIKTRFALLFLIIVGVGTSISWLYAQKGIEQKIIKPEPIKEKKTEPVNVGNVYNLDPGKSPLVIAAEKVSPAVVSVGGTETRLYRRRLYDPFFDEFIVPFNPYSKTTKIPYRGTGFIIKVNDDTGYVVTNYHVIRELKTVFVTLPDRREIDAEVLDADMVVDVALLKIKGENLPEIKMGDSEKLHLGEWVLALGNPFGNWIEDPRPSVTVGVVSALNRSFNPDYSDSQPNSIRVYQGMIQTDAAINPGNSGGPLVNIRGEAIGMNTFIFSRVGGSHGIGFALPINRVKKIVEEIMEFGGIRRLWLDLETINITNYYAKQLNLGSTVGALVRRIEQGGPADDAGLKVGDAIIEYKGRAVRNRDDFLAYFAAGQVGDTVKVVVIREGEKMDLEYMIKTKPEKPVVEE